MASIGKNSCNACIDTKLSKLERKALRKQTRKLFSFKKDSTSIEISEKPTRHVIVGNGGLICGVERTNLLSWFSRHGAVETVSMIPGKSFSVVSFRKLEDSIQAYSEIHGHPIDCPDEGSNKCVTLYLAYLLENSVLLREQTASAYTKMPVLASQTELHPPGLVVLEGFISKEKEAELIEYFQAEDSNDDGKDI